MQLKKHVIINKFFLLNLFIFSSLLILLLYAGNSYAAQTIGDLASNISGSFAPIAKLITAGAYVAGFAFGVGAILKFKAHKDNPTQVPIGTPLALLFVAIGLMFMPSLFQAGGKTLFGDGSYSSGGISGTDTISGS